MKKKLALGAACLLMACGARAELAWGWSFDAPHAGTVSASQGVDGSITVFNDWTSTETLYLSGSFISGARSATGYDGYVAQLADDFWAHHDYLRTTGLKAGETYSFKMFSFIPTAPAVPGNYSSRTTLQTADGTSSVHNLLRWQVAAVPEPETYALLIAGLGLIGLARRKIG